MKGVMHTIEVVIALAMIAVAIVGLFKPLQPTDNSAQLIQSGYAALQYLEDVGTLRPAAVANDTVTIRSALQPLLTNFGLEICNLTCAGATQPGAAALDYFISGSGSYTPVHIRLYVW